MSDHSSRENPHQSALSASDLQSSQVTVGGIGCYTLEMVGAGVLFAGQSLGLFIVAVAMVTNFYFMISGSWLLLIGISRDEPSR